MVARSIRLALLVLAAGVMVSQSSAHAQEATTTVGIEEVDSPTIFENSCSSPPTETRRPGTVRFARQGDIAGPLTVAFRVTGAAGPAEGSATFAEGADSTVAEIVAVGPAGSFMIEIIDGADYDLGDPSTAESGVPVATPNCASSSTTPIELPRTGGGSGGWLLPAGLGLLLAGGGLVGRSRSMRRA